MMWSGCETAAGLRGVTRKGDMSCGSVIRLPGLFRKQ